MGAKKIVNCLSRRFLKRAGHHQYSRRMAKKGGLVKDRKIRRHVDRYEDHFLDARSW